MTKQERWIQASFFRRGPFRGIKEEPIRAYIPKAEPIYGLDYPWPISIPRRRVLYQEEGCLIAALGKERIPVIFEKHKGESTEYRHRNKNFDDPRGSIKDFWYPWEGATLFPAHIEGLKVLEKDELEQAGVEEIGGKAYGLVRLKKLEGLGLEVPKFFVIPTSFYYKLSNTFGFEGRAEEIMSTYTPDEIMREEGILYSPRTVPWDIRRLFGGLGYFENFRSLFVEKIVEFGQWDHLETFKPLYFRSSSPLEDGRRHSFQGVFESELVEREYGSISGALNTVLLSPWTAYAEHYLRSRGLAGKVTRAMAVIVQEVPRDIRFTGRAFIDEDRMEIEYVEGLTRSGNYIGNKSVLDSRLNITQEIKARSNGQSQAIPSERIKKLGQLFQKVAEQFPDYGEKINLEFALGEEKVYLLQIRPTTREEKEVVVDLTDIDPENIIRTIEARWTGFSLGRVEGWSVNLLNVDPANFSEEWLSSIDQKYPGAIYIVSLYWADNKFLHTQQRIDHYQIMNEKNHILTPRKRGVIVCSLGDWFHDHFTESLRDDPCFLIFAPIEEFLNFPTGEPIGIVSDGRKAVIYKPKCEPEFSGPPLLSAEKHRENRYYKDRFTTPRLLGFEEGER